MTEINPLTSEKLQNLKPSERQRLIGDRLYPKISENVEPKLAGKITGMMLEMDYSHLLVLLSDKQQLTNAILSAINVLNGSNQSQHIDANSDQKEPQESSTPSITDDMLQNLKPETRKIIIGENLYYKIQEIQPELAAKITGMILELPQSQLLELLSDSAALKDAVDTAYKMLNGDGHTQSFNAMELIRRVMAEYDNGNYEKVITYCNEGIILEPNNHIFYSNRSSAYKLLNEYEKALDDANKCIQLKLDWPGGYVWKLRIYVAMDELFLAVNVYKEGLMNCLQIEPLKYAVQELESKLRDKANKAFENENYEETIVYYNKLIDLKPDNHRFYKNRSTAYRKLNKLNAAIQDANKCIQLRPKWRSGYACKADAFIRRKEYHLAIKVLAQGIKVCADNQSLRAKCEILLMKVSESHHL